MLGNEVDIASILDWPECKDIKDELNDPRYANRKHGSRATYAKGCDGPLCSKAERDRSRARNERRAKDAGRDYVPGRRISDRDVLLEAVEEWHSKNLLARRQDKKAS